AGRVDWRLGGILGIGGVLGGVAGAQVALSLDAALLRQLFAGFLVVMVMRMLNKTRASAHG
ncbi:MAG TPA: TSUP family transporter, partial [Acidimicrobiia bacterium]|nr:TSUP family transporter [Acidimicrobiia bacterium]